MRTLSAAVIGIALGIVCTGSAQTQVPPSPNTTVAVRGCVSSAQRDGSLEARSTGATATPETAAIEANRAEQAVNAYLLTDATLLNAAQSSGQNGTGTYLSKPSSFALEGLEPELSKHKGHRVEIGGTVMPSTQSGRGAAKQAAAEGIQRIKVASVKMIGTDCAAKKIEK